MIRHDTPWYAMIRHDTPWCAIIRHDAPWDAMRRHDALSFRRCWAWTSHGWVVTCNAPSAEATRLIGWKSLWRRIKPTQRPSTSSQTGKKLIMINIFPLFITLLPCTYSTVFYIFFSNMFMTELFSLVIFVIHFFFIATMWYLRLPRKRSWKSTGKWRRQSCLRLNDFAGRTRRFPYVIMITYFRTFVPTYLRNYVPSYLRTYVPSYLRTYVPPYLWKEIRIAKVSSTSKGWTVTFGDWHLS